MKLDEFQRAFEEMRRQDPFLFEGGDPPATMAELEDAEAQLGCKIGPKYSAFLVLYGGGSTGSCVVFSVSPASDWFIVRENLARGWPGFGFLAFAPNFVGDHYLFPIKDGIAQDRVLFYDHETGVVSESEYSDLFEYILAACR